MDRETEAAREWLAIVNDQDTTEWRKGLIVDAMMHIETLCDRAESAADNIDALEKERERIEAGLWKLRDHFSFVVARELRPELEKMVDELLAGEESERG